MAGGRVPFYRNALAEAGVEPSTLKSLEDLERLPFTGDVTRLDFEPCRCGRTTVRMARIKGRTDDMLVIKGVNVYPSQLEAALLTLPDLAPHYQLVVDRGKGFPTIEVHVEPAEERVRGWGGFDSRRGRRSSRCRCG